jgi:hypothetical protein
MANNTTEKQCARCGRTFRAGSNMVCNPCRTTDRECVTCGKPFRGRDRECYQCQAADRACIACGKTFHGVKRTCEDCRGKDRPCAACGRIFRGTKNTCPACTPPPRVCDLWAHLQWNLVCMPAVHCNRPPVPGLRQGFPRLPNGLQVMPGDRPSMRSLRAHFPRRPERMPGMPLHRAAMCQLRSCLPQPLLPRMRYLLGPNERNQQPAPGAEACRPDQWAPAKDGLCPHPRFGTLRLLRCRRQQHRPRTTTRRRRRRARRQPCPCLRRLQQEQACQAADPLGPGEGRIWRRAFASGSRRTATREGGPPDATAQ